MWGVGGIGEREGDRGRERKWREKVDHYRIRGEREK